jgi:ribonucleoside-triphosphate reductase (thioredoxin)
MSLIDKVKLSEEFLAQYRNKQPKWGFGGLGYIVYLRTYARKKPDGMLERWDETVQRITEGNFKIEAKRLEEIGKLTEDRVKLLISEMERFYHLVFNLVMSPPGRGLWMSGTEYAERVGDAENNCWGVSMRPQPYGNSKIKPHDGDIEKPRVSFAPVFTFDQAMKGGGVGVNVQRKYVNQIPQVNNDLRLYFVCDSLHKDFYTELSSLGVRSPEESFNLIVDIGNTFRVPDSREGWAEALQRVIDAHYEGITELVIDVSDIRPRGAEIKGFGGVASGPSPLVEMLTKVNEILNRRVNDYVTPTEWGDIIQLIGKCVVAGNVRRTALILIGDQNDKEFVESKNYSLPQNVEASQWRWASNNSVDIGINTDRETLRNLSVNIYYNGEPGYVNLELARNFGRIIDGFQKDIDGEVEVFNPCGEIPLPNASPCNLFEINLPKIHELISKGIETEKLYEEVAYLAARYAYRITFRPYEWEATRNVVTRHRRLGVGVTGITDFVLMKFGEKAILGFDDDDNPIFNKDVTKFFDQLYQYVREANRAQAKDLQANESIKVTTVKPSGTVSLLMGVSPGQHYHWAPYMIRRVRLAANAPLVPILRECGYHIEPAIVGYNTDGTYKYDYNTLVVEFPVKAPTAEHPKFQSAGEVPLREQAALQALLATYWSDNAVSATLTFKKAQPKPVYFADGTMLLDKFGNPELKIDKRDEDAIIEEITDVLDRYKGVIKSTSLLPHATDVYPQMPYEEITKERYEEMVAKLKAKPWEIIDGAIKAEEDEVNDIVGECAGGSCPIK